MLKTQLPSTKNRKPLLWLTLVLTLVMIVSTAPGMATADQLNIPFKTLGGTQFWTDGYIHAGWRIQENIITGHHRLLDPNNIRRAWGRFDQCLATFIKARRQEEIQPSSPHLVILLHGIARSTGTFGKMRQSLQQAGYDVATISYPSTRASLQTHAAALEQILDRTEGTQTVSFVTHSMGGLVVRHLLARDGAWKQRIDLHRTVQIAAPNQGSAIANRMADWNSFQTLYGRSGQQLTPKAATEIPAMTGEFAIIAGGKNDGQGFNPFLQGDDDGTVTVSETHLPGAKDFRVIPAIHARISNNPQTIEAVINFLETGKFQN